MPTVLKEGQKLLQCTVSPECLLKFDHMLSELAQKAPPGERHHFRNRGAFIEWLLSKVDLVTKAAEGVENVIADRLNALESQKEALATWQKELEEREEKLAEANAKLQEGLRFLKELAGGGVTKNEILAACRVLKDAELDPSEVVKAIQDAGGVLKWLRQVGATYETVTRDLATLKEEVAGHKQIIEQLQRREEEIERRIIARQKEHERATLAVAQACATARDVSLYVDYIHRVCEAQGAGTIWELPPVSALVIAGVILEAVAAAYGDKELTLVPGPKHPLPMQVTVREIARSLAPVEAYQEQMRAQVRMQAKAEMLAAQPSTTPS